jgi:hypothetical protein
MNFNKKNLDSALKRFFRGLLIEFEIVEFEYHFLMVRMFQTLRIHNVLVLGLPFGSPRKSDHNVCCNSHGQLQDNL